jgi:multicomponent Na+:H+ antiporter subunit D
VTITSQLPALQIVVPLVAAPVVGLLRSARIAWTVTVAASIASFAIAVQLSGAMADRREILYEMGSWPVPFGIGLRIDAFTALLLLIVSGASTLSLFAARRGLDAAMEPDRQPLFYAAWLLVLAGLAGIVVSGDAFNIFVFMEVSSLATYILIAGGPDRRALTAVFKYLIMGTIGATFYLIGVGLIYMMTGTLNLADMEVRLRDVTDLKPILVAAGFITTGLALKAAVFPLHAWLPNAYTHAPHAVTAFIAACSTKVSLYVLLRFDFFVFQQNLVGHALQFAGFLMPLAAAGILVASFVAVLEGNLKRLLAYSSIAQIGYILLGASFLSATGLVGAVAHMFNHALAKGTLFLAVACLGTQFARMRLRDLAGAGQSMPWTMAAFVIAGLSLIGIPGTAGFVSKWYLVVAAFQEGSVGIAAAALILFSSLLAVAYIWRIVEAAYFAEAPQDRALFREAPPAMLGAVWIGAAANIWFGLDPSLPLYLSGETAALLLRHVP